MEVREEVLAEKLRRLLREVAEVSLELEKAQGTWESRPHYTGIESRAHDLGQQLSREVQRRRMAELVAQAPLTAKCPGCGMRCDTNLDKRVVASIDGPIELPEQRCECPVCRRAFFPSAGGFGV